jgi:hypothetical protein
MVLTILAARSWACGVAPTEVSVYLIWDRKEARAVMGTRYEPRTDPAA